MNSSLIFRVILSIPWLCFGDKRILFPQTNATLHPLNTQNKPIFSVPGNRVSPYRKRTQASSLKPRASKNKPIQTHLTVRPFTVKSLHREIPRKNNKRTQFKTEQKRRNSLRKKNSSLKSQASSLKKQTQFKPIFSRNVGAVSVQIKLAMDYFQSNHLLQIGIFGVLSV